MSEINEPEAVPSRGHDRLTAVLGMREAAWSAVRERQQASDLPGLILAQMALELVEAAALRREHDSHASFMRARSGPSHPEPSDFGGPPVADLACVG